MSTLSGALYRKPHSPSSPPDVEICHSDDFVGHPSPHLRFGGRLRDRFLFGCAAEPGQDVPGGVAADDLGVVGVVDRYKVFDQHFRSRRRVPRSGRVRSPRWCGSAESGPHGPVASRCTAIPPAINVVRQQDDVGGQVRVGAVGGTTALCRAHHISPATSRCPQPRWVSGDYFQGPGAPGPSASAGHL